MVVRFLPEHEPAEPVAERKNMAEIIDLRMRFGAESADAGLTSTPRNVADAPAEVRREEAARIIETVPSVTSDRVVDDEIDTRASKLLGRRQLSIDEFRYALREAGFDHQDVEAVVQDYVTRLYLDDLALARAVADSLRTRKSASRGEIARKLTQRRVERNAIDTVLQELDHDEEDELLREAAHNRARKLRGLDRQTAERRLIGFLSRRGWGGHAVIESAREALDEAGITGDGSRPPRTKPSFA